ncbi:dTDP-4-dehydrorhamnose reductase [Gordonia sp. 852002-50816_SCH5313054-c]|nr:dTDP-4-dehydrorhamnose reductase [Gordonia sp. 852002-50816_SCH5313054-a]OBC12590.1 dTDP-4-dehydrorhamnose reductase [Gordonia sp. 852002-50816_SCH5313054-c]
MWIVGAGGQLGTALLDSEYKPGHVRALTSRDVDISDSESVARAFADLAAGDVVVNCAAYTNVDAAESDRERAVAVNASGPANLATQTARAGAWLIHISTDYVFGGAAAGSPREGETRPAPRTTPYEATMVEDDLAPETVYGATKLEGERAARAADPTATIVRTAWVYTGGRESPDFVGTMRRLEASRDTITVVDDQTGSPTYARDLADGVWELASRVGDDAVTGAVLHATNSGAATWFDVAQAVFEGVGADPSRVSPVTTDEFPRPAPRPAYSVLDASAWADAGLTPLRGWRDALGAAIAEPDVRNE